MRTICFFLLLGIFPMRVFAGDNGPLGARSAGFAQASVALGGDLWGAQNNQAGLAYITHFQAGAFYENRFLMNELSMKAVAAAMPLKAGVFGLEASSFGYSLYSENKAGLSFAKKFGERFSAAVQLDYFQTRIGENYGTASTVAGEIGLLAEPVKNLKLGFHIFNITRSKLGGSADESLPTIMRLGGLYTFSEKVFVTLEVEKDIDFKPIIRGGVEYHPVKSFYLRAGAASNPALTAFGFGLEFNKLRIDLASTFHTTLGFSPQVGLQYGID
jgi:hypothetical protein